MRNFIILFFLFLPVQLHAEAPAGADVTTDPNYYTSTNAEGLDSAPVLPAPPALDSLEFLLDQARYHEGLALRNSQRGEQARIDAQGLKLHESFSPAFGIAITKQDTPAIYHLVYSVAGELGDMATRSAKQKYNRIRPFVFYNTSTCYPEDEEKLANNGSYPSGHSAWGWGIALILAQLNPQNREAILKRGYEIGQSRVICGYHWQSDVNAGRLSGAAGVAVLQNNPRFRENLQKAQEEFQMLMRKGKINKVLP